MPDAGGTTSRELKGEVEGRGAWVAAGVTLALLSISYGSPLVLMVFGIVLSLQAGDRVEGDVMVDELAEVGVVRLDLRVVRSRGPGRRSPMRTHAVSSSR